MEFDHINSQVNPTKQISTNHYPGSAKEQCCHVEQELAKLQKLEELLEPWGGNTVYMPTFEACCIKQNENVKQHKKVGKK